MRVGVVVVVKSASLPGLIIAANVRRLRPTRKKRRRQTHTRDFQTAGVNTERASRKDRRSNTLPSRRATPRQRERNYRDILSRWRFLSLRPISNARERKQRLLKTNATSARKKNASAQKNSTQRTQKENLLKAPEVGDVRAVAWICFERIAIYTKRTNARGPIIPPPRGPIYRGGYAGRRRRRKIRLATWIHHRGRRKPPAANPQETQAEDTYARFPNFRRKY